MEIRKVLFYLLIIVFLHQCSSSNNSICVEKEIFVSIKTIDSLHYSLVKKSENLLLKKADKLSIIELKKIANRLKVELTQLELKYKEFILRRCININSDSSFFNNKKVYNMYMLEVMSSLHHTRKIHAKCPKIRVLKNLAVAGFKIFMV